MNSQLNTTKITRFTLPQFPLRNDPETWFNVADQIFITQQVNTEQEKFGFLLQSLSHEDISHIKDVINNHNAIDKYTQAKERFIARYGLTEEDKVRKLLEGTNVHVNKMPSLILHDLKQLTDTSESILRGIWLKKLPEKIREGVAAWTNKPLNEQADVADLLFKTHNDVVPPVPSIAALSPADSRMDSLFTLISQLQLQVAALTNDRNSRSRTHSKSRNSSSSNSHRSRSTSPEPSHRQSRGRNRTPYRHRSKSNRPWPRVVNEMCSFHFKFGQEAYRCMPGCKYFRKNDSKSEN